MTTTVKRFMRLTDVCVATGLPVSTLYRLMAEGTFPKNFRLSGKSVAWDADAVAAWQAERLAAGTKAGAA